MNGSTRTGANTAQGPSAAAGATRNVSAVVQDMITLVELQGQLFAADYRESKRRVIAGAVAIVVGVLLLMAALPVALFAMAALLISAGYSAAAAYGLAALGAALVATIAAFAGWRLARSSVTVFARSRDELTRNLETLKGLLGARER